MSEPENIREGEPPVRHIHCHMCDQDRSYVFESKVVWGNHEGVIQLTLSEDPSTFKNGIPHKAETCAMCSIKVLSGLLQMEAEELNKVFADLDRR